MNPSIAERIKKEFCVPVVEERGLALYLWFPSCPAEALEALWKSIPASGMKGLFDALGGEWILVDTGWLNPDSTEIMASVDDYERIDSPFRYRAEICCDEDSYLSTPDGRIVVHAGFDWSEAKGTDADPGHVQMLLERQRENFQWNHRT